MRKFSLTLILEKAVHYRKDAKFARKSEGYSIFCNHLLGASTICLTNRFPSRSLRLCGSNAAFRLIVPSLLVMTFPLQLCAGQLDDYYLTAFGFQAEQPNITALQKSLLLPATEPEVVPHCGTPLKKNLRRDWDLLEQTTQKVLAKELARPALCGPEATPVISPSGRFKIHYTASPCADAATPTWVQTVAQTFDDVAAAYTSLQWQLAPTSGNGPYDVYLRDLAPRYYGVTTDAQPVPSAGYPNAYSSWIELDNNFTDSIYKPYSPLQSLQITAAHEYHHAIQFGYNYYFDIWYAEATSTWMEDELYDNVNQLYSYIPAWFTQSELSLDVDADPSSGGGYGRWIFNRYLSERHGSTIIRNVWEGLGGINSPNGYGDIPMAPVLDGVLASTYGSSLGNDFFGFAKRVYTSDWTTHTTDTADIHPYSPVATYSTYPVKSSTGSPLLSVNLPHYSFAYYKLTPSASVSPDLFISISDTGGISAAVFKKSAGIITEVQPITNGKLFTVTGFSALNPTTDEVVLLIVNTTNLDNQIASFSAETFPIPGDCDSDGTVSIAEVQGAINMFLGVEPAGRCVNTDNSSNVSIAEVQKVINRFLGL